MYTRWWYTGWGWGWGWEWEESVLTWWCGPQNYIVETHEFMAYARYNSVDHTACCHAHTRVLKCMPVVRPCQLLLQSIFLLTQKVDIILQRGIHSAQHTANRTLHCIAHCSQAQLQAMKERKHWLPAMKLTSSKPRFLVGNFASPVQFLPWTKYTLILLHTTQASWAKVDSYTLSLLVRTQTRPLSHTIMYCQASTCTYFSNWIFCRSVNRRAISVH